MQAGDPVNQKHNEHMKVAKVLANCKTQTKRNECADAVGILRFSFKNGGLNIIFRDGRTLIESTPLNMTANEHLSRILASHVK